MTSIQAADLATACTPHFREDYADRVYAGVIGKLIGVYLGRPFEQWSFQRIRERLGDIRNYVSHELDQPLVVPDDDISGTFTFIRAAIDSGRGYAVSSEDIAESWLNYLIENRSVLWWGGLGNSTEHTAYIRLKHGLTPPWSGAAQTNGKVVSEQIGAQIFIDGWAMIAPGAPALAAELAGRAARVSHDGEAVFGAQSLAAMEAAAFEIKDIDQLLDIGLSFVPRISVIAQLAADVRRWHAANASWRAAREQLDEKYGYDVYGGGCHIVPNHGLVLLALLYGEGDFARSLEIVNTAGWDTDCNSGNLGALLGILNGVEGIDAGPDWRTPLADRMYLPTADPGSGVSDALREATRITQLAITSAGLDYTPPKAGARFHFCAPGAVQGFATADGYHGTVRNERTSEDSRALRIISPESRTEILTPTFVSPESFPTTGYGLDVSPSLYSGQILAGRVLNYSGYPQKVQPVIRVYSAHDRLTDVYGPTFVADHPQTEITWRIPDTGSQPIQSVGLLIRSESGIDIFLDHLTWSGSPTSRFARPATGGSAWHRAWARSLDYFHRDPEESFRLIQNEGRGLMIIGTQEWTDYRVCAGITPHASEAVGVLARVQGLRRYYAARWTNDGTLQLIRRAGAEDVVLASTGLAWEADAGLNIELLVRRTRLQAAANGRVLLEADDPDGYSSGAVGLMVENGRAGANYVDVSPA